MQMNLKIIAGCCLLANAAFCAVDALPERIISGYYGWNVLRKGDYERNAHMADVLAANGFNSYETKIQAGARHFDVAAHVPKIKELADHVRSKGMIFQVYLYTIPYLADRHADWAEHSDLPSPVAENGERIEKEFLLTDPAVWRQLFFHAFELAKHQEEIGFASLKFDVERIDQHVSYDDATWKAFCAKNGSFDAMTPVAERGAALRGRKGGKAAYNTFFYDQVEAALEQFVKELRAIRPNIVLGYMPARSKGRLSEILNKVLAAPGIPAIADGWDMYNGSGYVDAVTQANVKRAQKGNPKNIYVTWLRPDNYIPEDVAVCAYHAGVKTGGYSMWTLAMLDDTIPPKKRRYPLQKGFEIPDYMAALAKANAAIREDIASGTLSEAKRIAFKAPSARVAPLELSKVNIPKLKAACSAGSCGSGKPCSLVLREQQTMLMPRKAGEPISVTLAHLSKRHHAALQYAVIGPNGDVLRNEAVTRLQKATFSFDAPEQGTYALVVSGGRGGQAWYSVSINGAWAVDARKGTYLFNAQTMYVSGHANSAVQVQLGTPQQEYVCQIEDAPPVMVRFARERKDYQLPAKPCVKVAFSEPKPPSSYSQDFLISFPKGAKEPFIFASPEAAVEISD